MKDKRLSKKMRWAAGIIYGVLCLYELFTVRYLLANAAITDVPVGWLFEMAVMVGAGVLSVWLLGGSDIVKPGARRGVVVGTVFVVAFELITYQSQVGAIYYTLMTIFPSLQASTGNTLYQLIAMIIRLLLMILAAFFVQSASVEMDLDKAESDVEDASENLDEVLDEAETALEKGVDAEEAAEIAEEVMEAREELADALVEMDEAVIEVDEEK